jgi:cytochrome b6-f complex iron-sulfur subunit
MSKEDSTTPSKPAPPKPAPAKPAAAAKDAVPRRSFISWMTLAWTAFTASMLAAATATGRFMFPNVLFEPPPTFKAGLPNEIQVGQVDERFKQKFAVWLVRTAYDQYANAAGIFALSTVCQVPLPWQRLLQKWREF